MSAYARQRAVDELEFDVLDILLVLGELEAQSFEKCVASEGFPEDMIWVFSPAVEETVLWIRLLERNGILVVSFHPA